MGTDLHAREGTDCERQEARESGLPVLRETTDSSSQSINFTVVDGVARPNTPEDTRRWEEFCAQVDADPERYAGYAWVSVTQSAFAHQQ